MSKAVALMEYVLENVQVNVAAYAQLVKDMKVHYANAKTQQRSIFGQLQSYVMWGKDVAHKDLITPEQMEQIKPADLVELLKSMHSFTHKIMYYGPMSQRQFQSIIRKEHRLPETLLAAPTVKKDELLSTDQDKVYLVNYQSNQINFGMYAKAHLFSQDIYPITAAYNAYFGGTMSGIVFQEMREARGLAYTATARLTLADMPWTQYAYTTYIATQNDKLKDATQAFLEIINEMPLSEGTFDSAKKLTLCMHIGSRAYRPELGVLLRYRPTL
jgi:predicted Zn-dependent peptidase